MTDRTDEDGTPRQHDAGAGGHSGVENVISELVERFPGLQETVSDILAAYRILVGSYDAGGAVYLCGSGGSFCDCLHISGELLKSFERSRSLSDRQRQAFAGLPDGEALARELEQGLAAVVLGANPALSSAVLNDKDLANMNYAQELFSLGHSRDVLVGISTSGNARNVFLAAQVAKAIGMKIIAMTGSSGGVLAPLADVAIKVPAAATRKVQEFHEPVYHALCLMLEEHYFGKSPRR